MGDSTGRSIGRGLLVGVLVGVVVGFALGARVTQLNHWGLGVETLIVGGCLAALYALVFATGLGALGALAALFGTRPTSKFYLAAAVAGVLLLNTVLRYNLAVQFGSVVPHMTWLGLATLFGLTLASGLTFWALLGSTPRRFAGGLAVAAALIGVIHLVNVRREVPRTLDLPAEVSSALASQPAGRVAPAARRFEEAEIVVLGIDGLSFESLVPWIRDGRAPNLRILLEDAAYGYLATDDRPISPVVWETIATGQPRSRHGIGYHVHFVFPGMKDRVRVLPEFFRGNCPMLLRRALTLLAPYAPWARFPSGSHDGMVARFYDVMGQNGVSVGSFNWMNTGPTYPFPGGWVRGFGPTPPHYDPADLVDGLPPLPPPPRHGGKAGDIQFFKDRVPYEYALHQRFVEIALQRPTEVLMYYTHFHDAINHLNWKHEAHGEGSVISGASVPVFETGEATLIGAGLVDSIVGDTLARARDDATIVIVSDHGFDWRGHEHDNGPPGVFIARGPGVRPGLIEGASIFDVAPTLLHWSGLPVAKDMDGAPLDIAVPRGPLDRVPNHIASFGEGPVSVADGEVDREDLERHEEYLRSLGYVN